MSPTEVFWLAIAGLTVTCLAATGARSLASFSRHDLEEICHRRNAKTRLGEILRRHEPVGMAAETIQVIATAVTVASVVFWALLEFRPANSPPDWPHLALSAAVGALALVAVEIWLPWAFARLWATWFVYRTWPLWRTAALVLWPLTLGTRFFDTLLHRLAGRVPEEPDEESFEDEIRTIVTEGHREGLLEEDAREMIEGVIELSDLDVSEIMTPRTDMVSLPVSMSWQELLDIVVDQSHTRIPVYDKNRDDIIGILYTKDLLPELAKGPSEPNRPWTSLLRDPYFVPETKPLDVLLQEFQRTRHHMAVVLDEYGGVSGIVTMEDVLEEIVGEIIDEYDKDLVDGIRQLDEGVAEALGNVHIDEVNERLSLKLPEDGDFDTIGGLVFSGLGYVPQVGEQWMQDNVRLTVLEATRRRILRLRIEVLDLTRRETA
ncbi:MAG: HlyC/CorC family transporter [Pirellulales bacterium]|nr:HlyC/CorC family transporter [Pirellulales bacterium]